MAEHSIIPQSGPRSQVPGGWRDIGIACLLAFAFLLLALHRLDQPPFPVFDEIFHARAGVELASGRMPHELSHPPLVKDVVALALVATGSGFDPASRRWTPAEPRTAPRAALLAWRVPSAIAGALAVALLYLLALELAGSRAAALAAATLLALDGCFFVHARVAQTNVYELLFVLAAALSAWRACVRGQDRWLPLAGAALGAAVACRWSALAAWALIAGWLAFQLRAEPRRMLRLAAAFTLVPLTVYVASYVPLVALVPGGLADPGRWKAVVIDAQLRIFEFHAYLREVHPYQSAWWSWPLMARPVWYWFTLEEGRAWTIWAIGNAALWWASLPALLAAAASRSRAGGYVALLGLGCWLAWAVQPRALTFMHYYMPAIPYACIALALVGRRLWRGETTLEPSAGRAAVGAFMFAAVAWFAFYWPVLTWTPISDVELMRRVWFGKAWL